MNHGVKIRVMVRRFAEWESLGEGVYLNQEKHYVANNSGQIWPKMVHRVQFKKGIIIVGLGEFRIERIR